MRFWHYQRNQFTTRTIGGGRRHTWTETAVVAVFLGGAALITSLQPTNPLSTQDQIQRADWLDDLIDIISGGGSGGSGGSTGGGSTGTSGNP
jgi:hypothetical protein